MTTSTPFSALSIRFGFLLAALCILLAPSSAFAASVIIGSVDVSSLVSISSTPTLSGLAFGTNSVRVTIYKEGSTQTLYTSEVIEVTNDRWQMKVPEKLLDGTYNVMLSTATGEAFTITPTGVLTIGVTTASQSSATLVVSSVPLLFGGVVHAGGSVPVSYLQITNIGKDVATLKGFWIKQNGSASTQSIIGLTTVDDQGGSRGSAGGTEGSVLFKNGLAFAPTEVTAFVPGQMRLFTIKATLTGNVYASLGTQLKIEVTSLDTDAKLSGAFPIQGTTWTIAN